LLFFGARAGCVAVATTLATRQDTKTVSTRDLDTFKIASRGYENALRLTYFQLTIKKIQFLRLTTTFLVVLRLTVNPIETIPLGWQGEYSFI